MTKMTRMVKAIFDLGHHLGLEQPFSISSLETGESGLAGLLSDCKM